jgi:hypothetical protein
MQEEVIAAIPQSSADNILEVALMHEGGNNPCVELRYLAWGGIVSTRSGSMVRQRGHCYARSAGYGTVWTSTPRRHRTGR